MTSTLLYITAAASMVGAPSLEQVRAATATSLAPALEAYRWLHAHPELSNQEFQTAAFLGARLRTMGLEVHDHVGGTGLIGVLQGGLGDQPVVVYRADMDALPITEATGLPYASQNPGVMHACGHDVHMATALGTLNTLQRLRDRWSGTVIFVGQPAEELGEGAARVLEDPQFKSTLRRLGSPRVVLALHDAADLPAGVVSLKPEYAFANVDTVDVVLYGRGGHGARPHESVDPVVMGAQLVMALQTLVSRRLAPGTQAVVTVGSFQAGAQHNVIAPTSTLLLTVRSYSDAVRTQLLDDIRHTARHIAQAHRAPRDPTVRIKQLYTPAVYNDPTWNRRLTSLFQKTLGPENVRAHAAQMIGEDFGRYSRTLNIPGVMYRLGATDPKLLRRSGSPPGLHSDKFAPKVSPTLRTGVLTMALALLAGLDAEPDMS